MLGEQSHGDRDDAPVAAAAPPHPAGVASPRHRTRQPEAALIAPSALVNALGLFLQQESGRAEGIRRTQFIRTAAGRARTPEEGSCGTSLVNIAAIEWRTHPRGSRSGGNQGVWKRALRQMNGVERRPRPAETVLVPRLVSYRADERAVEALCSSLPLSFIDTKTLRPTAPRRARTSIRIRGAPEIAVVRSVRS